MSEGRAAVSDGQYPPDGGAAAPRDGREARSADEILHALASLDPVEDAALRMVYFHGFTQSQAARALGLPQLIVSRCVAHGMHELARRLVRIAK